LGISDLIRRTNHRVCPWWLCYTFDNPLRRLFHDPERLLAPHVRPGATAVDIGCGMGYFTIGLARLVGAKGKVFAVDLQRRMLAALEKRALAAGVADCITTILCTHESLVVRGPADFVLAFWMAHEVPDLLRFFREIRDMLQDGGRLLLVEPKLHVTHTSFARTVETCRQEGFVLEAEPAVAVSRAVLMRAVAQAT
jgi:ubiquinone/menaquinone biosynthesis C-methylase UbiE